MAATVTAPGPQHGPEETPADATTAHASGVSPAKAAVTRVPLSQRPWWPWAKRVVVIGFLVFVAVLLVVQARAVEWGEVFTAMRAYPWAVLAGAAALAALSHV
ncbi:MAG: UPF0104 family protein, partial [Comamonadaceae bacterium]